MAVTEPSAWGWPGRPGAGCAITRITAGTCMAGVGTGCTLAATYAHGYGTVQVDVGDGSSVETGGGGRRGSSGAECVTGQYLLNWGLSPDTNPMLQSNYTGLCIVRIGAATGLRVGGLSLQPIREG